MLYDNFFSFLDMCVMDTNEDEISIVDTYIVVTFTFLLNII